MNYKPDKWLLVLVNDHLKVFGTWWGGYLEEDSWRLNSGVTDWSQDEDGNYLFTGWSGSVYTCHPDSYGTTAYGLGVLESFKRVAPDLVVVEREDVLEELEIVRTRRN